MSWCLDILVSWCVVDIEVRILPLHNNIFEIFFQCKFFKDLLGNFSMLKKNFYLIFSTFSDVFARPILIWITVNVFNLKWTSQAKRWFKSWLLSLLFILTSERVVIVRHLCPRYPCYSPCSRPSCSKSVSINTSQSLIN